MNESSQECRRNVYGREWFHWGALTYVRIRLNQVKAKANYYIGCLYILSRMSMRILQVNYGDCAIRLGHGLKQERTEMRIVCTRHVTEMRKVCSDSIVQSLVDRYTLLITIEWVTPNQGNQIF